MSGASNSLNQKKSLVRPGGDEAVPAIPAANELPHESLAEIVDSAVQGIIIHKGGPPLFVNRAVARLVGARDVQEVVGRSILEWIHEGDRARIAGHVAARLEGNNADVPRDYQFRLLRLDGGERWVDCRATAIRWQGDLAVLATIFDITPQKQAEAARARSQTLFERVFTASPDMLALFYLDSGVFLDVNPHFAEAIGLDRRHVLGQTVFDLRFWDDTSMPLKLRAAMRQQRSIRDREAVARCSDGRLFPIRFSAEKLVVDGADVVLIIARDISEEKRREAELRTSRDAAELANRSKSEFLANMSHELRTPLNAILGFSEIIRAETLGPIGDPRYKEYAADIHRSGSHLLEIINDILDLSKVEAGRLEIHPEKMEVGEVVDQCVRLVRERARRAGISLSVAVEPMDLEVAADRRLVKQILLNLLSNAIKFTPEGGKVTIRARRTPDGSCLLCVADTGIGMSPGEIRKAMVPFGQVDSVFTRRHEGTGLGLPLVQAFVQAHGGTLKLESEKGRGTRADVILPDVLR
ncbi:MAG: PAS domain S-box protein [Alphaproteobacteria bacterium]|nr:MAG: PAS domain S-box protein [Alphaproteobacteria bacterium]